MSIRELIDPYQESDRSRGVLDRCITAAEMFSGTG
jgi:hypothetical protein